MNAAAADFLTAYALFPYIDCRIYRRYLRHYYPEHEFQKRYVNFLADFWEPAAPTPLLAFALRVEAAIVNTRSSSPSRRAL